MVCVQITKHVNTGCNDLDDQYGEDDVTDLTNTTVRGDTSQNEQKDDLHNIGFTVIGFCTVQCGNHQHTTDTAEDVAQYESTDNHTVCIDSGEFGSFHVCTAHVNLLTVGCVFQDQCTDNKNNEEDQQRERQEAEYVGMTNFDIQCRYGGYGLTTGDTCGNTQPYHLHGDRSDNGRDTQLGDQQTVDHTTDSADNGNNDKCFKNYQTDLSIAHTVLYSTSHEGNTNDCSEVAQHNEGHIDTAD